MKDKLRKIMYECFPFDGFTCFVDKTRVEIAIKKIQKAYEMKPTNLCPSCKQAKRWCSCPASKERLVASDCDCRHCKPDRWMLDTDRDVWIRKT